MDYITLDWINNNKIGLLHLALLCENDIKNLWIQNIDEDVENLQTLVYRYDAPLYQKMIWRFRNCKNNPCVFFIQIDPSNQNYLIQKYFGYSSRYYNNKQLLEFFAWIKNMLGEYDLRDLDKSGQLINLWKNNNEIDFFFMANILVQNNLISRYNRECVDRYNEII